MRDTADDALFAVLRDVLARANGGRLSPSEIAPGMKIRDIGIDSIKFIMVMLDIEDRIQRRVFNADNIGGVETVSDLWSLVNKESVT